MSNIIKCFFNKTIDRLHLCTLVVVCFRFSLAVVSDSSDRNCCTWDIAIVTLSLCWTTASGLKWRDRTKITTTSWNCPVTLRMWMQPGCLHLVTTAVETRTRMLCSRLCVTMRLFSKQPVIKNFHYGMWHGLFSHTWYVDYLISNL